MMRPQKVTLLVFTLTLAFVSHALRAQSPTPIVVQAATATTATAPAPIAVAKDSEPNPVAMRMLQQMKAANEDVLKKQEATLQRLDEIQKAAEQLKIFSKRG
jgi:hypothetical protein